MTPDLTLAHIAAWADHRRLQDRAERGWLADEARSGPAARRGVTWSIRRSIGAALIWTGARPQDAPRMTTTARLPSGVPADDAVL